ncbi:PREDICTED: 4-coumarate--CoA ligase 1-like [Papilio xuthus]|uniref:4-coumarate--CoA ligase 1-like n=1 Tax=Papilio xuthus TaxID=66420 RepID=A0AAJ6ZHK6_PAPXU|nr:PREDICTED: 4-coumarate--CoA ligase 1-like [Papilio xuthus]
MMKNLEVFHRALKLLEATSKISSVSVRRLNAWGQDGTIKSPYKNIEIPNCTLYEYIWQNLDKWPERTVSVTVMLPNIPDFPLVALGILEAGGVISTINPVYTPHEIQRQLLLSEAKAVVTICETVNTVKEAIKLAKLNIPIIAVKTNGESVPQDIVSFHELTEDVHIDKSCLKEVRRSIDDICFLPYSSGTTGLPKGVQLLILSAIKNVNNLIDKQLNYITTHQDAVMTVLPLFHIYGASVLMFHKMSQGIKLVTVAKFQPETLLDALEKYKTNVLFVAPPLVIMMATHPASSPKKFQYLETIVNGAAPLSETDAERFFTKSERKLDFRQGYGLTETSPVVALTPRGMDNYGCVGYPIPSTNLKIVNSEMKTLGANEKGELLVKGPQVMRGYKDNAVADKETFTEDGWFRTGDLAIADHTGVITISDRLKELIKVKGFQVPPAELEAVLREHPDVSEAAVIGVPHPRKGESPKAFVVLKSNSNTSAKEISEFVEKKVAPYKKINDIMFIDSIPKSSAGKILRRILKEKYC